MPISQRGLDLIRRHEGFSAIIYKCPAGYPTIGYGHVVTPAEQVKYAQGITRVEATSLLQLDVAKAFNAALRLTRVPLNQNELDALTSFIFNLGAGAYQRSTLRQRLNRGDKEGTAAEFKRWVYAGGRKLPGLVARRNEESLLFAEPVAQHAQVFVALPWLKAQAN